MAGIQSSIGLITGVPIADTVDQLIAISARSRDLLISRTAALRQQQVAIAELTALVIGVQFAMRKVTGDAVFSQKSAKSSDSSLLSASVTGQPTNGTYQYTPVRKAQVHHLISSGFAADHQPLGAGTLRFRFGGFIDQGKDLSRLNGGQGVQRGQIRITDRSGATAIVDLRFAQTVDDVLNAINAHSSINVTAVADGDHFRLIDNTGQSVSNLKVQEIGLGKTAADLGLAGIDVALNEATGLDVLRLHDHLNLARLNDGNGIRFGPVDDLVITFRDNSSLALDLTSTDEPTTLGEVVARINGADPGRLGAAISASGDRIELTDLTGGVGTFIVSSGTGSRTAEDLGIATSTSSSTITSRRLQSGLKTSLLASLGGSQGLGPLGELLITDRAGHPTDTIDLSSAETLDDVVRLMNATVSSDVTARINDARNGILLVDHTVGISNFVVASSSDGLNTAEKLKIATNAAVSMIDSGSLDLQLVSENTRIESLNHGKGVQPGSFTITATDGKAGAVNLAVLQPKRLGDLIDAINALGIGVVAEINDAGDGVRLRDTALGSGKIAVKDVGNGRAAADLRIAGSSGAVDVSGTLTEVIDGSTTYRVDIDSDDSLTDVTAKINALGAGVAASVVNDGSGTSPHRLSLLSQLSGKAGQLLIDSSQAGFQFQPLADAQDALLVIGSANSLSAGVLASSSTNRFDNVLSGASLTVVGTAIEPVNVTVETTDSNLVNQVQLFVDQYNKLRDKLAALTFFNESDNSTAILFGSNETLRIETTLTRLITDRYTGIGAVQSFEQIGLSLDDKGRLSLDKQKLQAQFAADPTAVRQLFEDETRGVVAKFDAAIELLAGPDNSLLINRTQTLQRRIDTNNERLATMNERLGRERERLLLDFFRLETIIGRLQANLSAITSLQSIPPLSFTNSSPAS